MGISQKGNECPYSCKFIRKRKRLGNMIKCGDFWQSQHVNENGSGSNFQGLARQRDPQWNSNPCGRKGKVGDTFRQGVLTNAINERVDDTFRLRIREWRLVLLRRGVISFLPECRKKKLSAVATRLASWHESSKSWNILLFVHVHFIKGKMATAIK